MRSLLHNRSEMLRKCRSFFYDRAIVEVDCPLLSSAASVDLHIDLMKTTEGQFLHSSPEYGMKRLLSLGSGDLFQISHVFRKEEFGRRHNPEFTLVEWYRIGFSFHEMIEETAELMRLFLGPLCLEKISYRNAFLNYVGLDPFLCETHELRSLCKGDFESDDREDLLNYLLATKVEPHLGKICLTALYGYPKAQAALAKVVSLEGIPCAERFEIYCKGIELCNGYHELCDPKEQRKRFVEANGQREKLGKTPLPIDERFLQALEKGLPDCCGVAVGFDRLFMLQQNKDSLEEILPFHWNNA